MEFNGNTKGTTQTFDTVAKIKDIFLAIAKKLHNIEKAENQDADLSPEKLKLTETFASLAGSLHSLGIKDLTLRIHTDENGKEHFSFPPNKPDFFNK